MRHEGEFGIFLSLADGFDAQAADLDKRAQQCTERAEQIRNGDITRIAPDPKSFDEAARINSTSASVFKDAAGQLRYTVRLVERLRTMVDSRDDT